MGDLTTDQIKRFMEERGYEPSVVTRAGIKYKKVSSNPHQDYVFVPSPIPREIFADILREKALRPLDY
jgi:hypothetical protein